MTKTDRHVYEITKLLYAPRPSAKSIAEATRHLNQLVEDNRQRKNQRSLAKAGAHLALAAQSKKGSEAQSDFLEETLHELTKVSSKGYDKAVDEVDRSYHSNPGPGPDYPDYEPRGVSQEQIEAAWAAAGEVARTTDERYFLFHQLLDETPGQGDSID